MIETESTTTGSLARIVRLCDNCNHSQEEHWNGRGCCQNSSPAALSPRIHFCDCSRFKLKKPNDPSSAAWRGAERNQ